jgi:hypothetical protein
VARAVSKQGLAIAPASRGEAPQRAKRAEARIPSEARDGLMRAWLEILKARHPDVTWIPSSE